MVALDSVALEGLRRVAETPAIFMSAWLGADLWGKQVEIAEAVRDHRRVAVKSCHGSGKSYTAARIVVWFLHAFPGSMVITTAPTANQVENILWREIRSVYAGAPMPLLGRCLTTRIELAPDWYALGFKAADSETDRFQGFHATDLLVVADEAAGIADSVYEALDSVLTSENAKLLMIGNPTSTSGRFYDAFHALRGMYHTITIAAADTPNLVAGRTVRPYLITQQWVSDAIAEHGEDSPYVAARVNAEFAQAGSNVLIPLSWIDAATNRGTEDAGDYEAGLDVARMGDDETTLCIRRGIAVVAEYAWSKAELMETVGRVRSILADYPEMASIKVDAIGIGAGVADRLSELGYPVVEVNVGAASRDKNAFANLRCELWWDLRERFREGGIAGEINQRTQGQLANVRYSYDSRRTKPLIERKEDAKKRGVHSPDRAEALLLAFATIHAPQRPKIRARSVGRRR